MTYSFSTYPSTAINEEIPLPIDITGYTLSVDYSMRRAFSSTVLTKTLTGSGKNVVLSLTAAEVDTLQDAYFRITATKNGQTAVIQTGTVDFQPTPISQDSGGLTAAEVNTLISNALSGVTAGSGLTEQQVADLIAQKVADVPTASEVQNLIAVAIANAGGLPGSGGGGTTPTGQVAMGKKLWPEFRNMTVTVGPALIVHYTDTTAGTNLTAGVPPTEWRLVRSDVPPTFTNWNSTSDVYVPSVLGSAPAYPPTETGAVNTELNWNVPPGTGRYVYLYAKFAQSAYSGGVWDLQG